MISIEKLHRAINTFQFSFFTLFRYLLFRLNLLPQTSLSFCKTPVSNIIKAHNDIRKEFLLLPTSVIKKIVLLLLQIDSGKTKKESYRKAMYTPSLVPYYF